MAQINVFSLAQSEKKKIFLNEYKVQNFKIRKGIRALKIEQIVKENFASILRHCEKLMRQVGLVMKILLEKK